MNWTDCIGNKKPIENLYSVPPSLNGVRVLEVSLHQDGPFVSIRINLNEFPDAPPKEWVANGFNRVQITLMFIEVEDLKIRGWSSNNIVDVVIERRSDRVSVIMRGQGTEIEGVFSFVEVEKVSAYLDLGSG
jgi:hypothetical protein